MLLSLWFILWESNFTPVVRDFTDSVPEHFSSQHGLIVEIFSNALKSKPTQRIRFIKQKSTEVDVMLSQPLNHVTKDPVYFHLSTLFSIGLCPHTGFHHGSKDVVAVLRIISTVQRGSEHFFQQLPQKSSDFSSVSPWHKLDLISFFFLIKTFFISYVSHHPVYH